MAGDGDVMQGMDREPGIERNKVKGFEGFDGKEVGCCLVVIFFGEFFGADVANMGFGIGAFDFDGMGEIGGNAVGTATNPGVLIGGNEANFDEGNASEGLIV